MGLEMGSTAAHPGRPKGLPKTGGRRAGTPNRKTLGFQARLMAAGASPEEAAAKLPPFDFLAAVVADETQPIATRIDAAKSLLPYTNFRNGLVDSSGRDIPLTIQILRFSDLPEPELKVIEHDSSPTSH
jgi:hypothetical protein